MAGILRALVISPDGTAEVREVADKLEALQAVVGGYLEAVTLDGEGGTVLYVNEDGKAQPFPRNALAGALVEQCHPGFLLRDWIAGTAMVLGSDEDGGEADCPEWVLRKVGLA